MAQVHVGEYADIHLNAYPDRVLKGRISNILPVIDPNIRTAKVRLEVENPGLMRLGMFVTATFHGETAERMPRCRPPRFCTCTTANGSIRPLGERHFRRLEVAAGDMLPGNMQEVVSGIKPGDAGGRQCSGLAEHGGAVDDSASWSISLSTTAFWFWRWRCCCSSGARSRSISFPSKPIRTWRTTMSRSSRSGPAFRPSKSSSRSPFRSKS